MAGAKKIGPKPDTEGEAERMRAELSDMIAKIPAHQLVWMVNAAQEHFVGKVESLELKILRAERFSKNKTALKNAEDWIAQYAPLIRFLDALKNYVAHVDSVKSAEAVAAFIKSRR